MRGLGDSTQHELKVLGEQGVHTGGLARLAAGVANSSPLEVHPVAAGRLPVGPGAVPVACAEEITCLPRRASRTRRLCDTHECNCSLFVGLTHAGRSKMWVELGRETLKTTPTIQFFSRED